MDPIEPPPAPKGTPLRLQARFVRAMAFFVPAALGFIG